MELTIRFIIPLLVVASSMFTLCTYDNGIPFTPETSVQANVVWMLNGTIQNPSEVSFVRITVISLCDNAKATKVVPFSNDTAAAKVKTGCEFSLLFEGLDQNYQTLYMGEITNQVAIGPSVSVRITAQACTPAPPDSLKAAAAGKRIRLSWIDRSNNETGFIIQRSINNKTSFLTIDTTTSTTYMDTLNIKRGYPYFYLVYAYNNIGLSIAADTISRFELSANTRPEFISTATGMDSIVEAGKAYIDTIRYVDNDIGDSLWVSLISPPQGCSLKDSILTWIPDSTQAGKRYTILAVLTDQDLSKDSLVWSINVKGTDTTSLPPVFSVSKLDLDTTLLLGQLYSDTLRATDPEKQKLTYKLLSAPLLATIDSVSAVVKWQADSLGRFEFTAMVQDNTAKSDTVWWSVIVSDIKN
ncbi:MAG TPA: hypothetical protein VHO70_07340 [Chitinispirillaceae bacterium]|nr:hypothetical protein [Chitinispirillaceae bacterium]